MNEINPPSLKDVLPSAANALGHALTESQFLPIPPSRHVVVILIDGLGEISLNRHLNAAAVFESSYKLQLQTEFPSTTPVALGSLGTGLPPGAHGFVGASFWLPDAETMLSPLKWGSEPHPISMAPEPTIFELAEASGISTATIGKMKHINSGMTRSVLRGSQYLAAESLEEMKVGIGQRLRDSRLNKQTGLTYAYWPELDRVGHVHGPESSEWIAELQRVAAFVESIASDLASDESCVVVSDHGMVACPPESRISIDSHPGLLAGVRRIGGEPRMRHVYVVQGAEQDVAHAWKAEAGERAMILERDEAIDQGLFRVSDSEIKERIGDLVVISLGDTMFTSSTDPRTSSLLGQHGSLSPEEMQIPFRVFSGSGA
ncbi:MAG: nucleotide pyrophosphatase/phosphodiesterase family protein [Candidatus Nanopelagicales bacterium]|jgi:predicted AlkP superfamily pyrophosphatase or phosphodiesterase